VNPIVYAIPVFMLSILLEAWVARRRAVATYDIPDALTSLNFGILSQVSGVFVRVITFGIYVWVFENLRLATLPADAWWVWLGALITYDFLYYWVHRCGHEVNLMWAAHQVHHSSEYFNLSTALRQTSTGAFASWPFYLPMAIAGVPPMVFGAVALIDLLYQYWVHTELVRRLGILERFMVTPSNHRVHHGQNDYCIDKNYGGIFSIWDQLFGTYADERPDEKVIYGVRKPLRSWDPVWANIQHYLVIARFVGAAHSWREKFAHVFGPPRGTLHLQSVGEPPFKAAEFVPFATPYSPTMKMIGAISTVVGTVMLMTLYVLEPQLSLAENMAYSAVMLIFFSFIGRLWLHPRMMGATR